MLYDAKWEEKSSPKTTPEIGSKTHILEWLKSKPAEEAFVWTNPSRCVCGQYSEEFLESPLAWGQLPSRSPLNEMNAFAFGQETFGQVYQTMCKRWA